MRKIILGLIQPAAIGAALFVITVAAVRARGAEANSGPPTVRIGMTRSKDYKFLVPAAAPGGQAWLALDTGAPISCADETKTALFKFQSFRSGAGPAPMMINGQQAKISLIPQLNFGGMTVKNLPAVLVDFSAMNRMRQSAGDRGPVGDAIIGLDALFRMHAVIDCGAGKLFVHPNPVRENAPGGWSAVPMRLVEGHLVVPVALNGYKTSFAIDTGSPSSIIDSAICLSQRVPVGVPNVPITAIHHELKAALGTLSSLAIGSVDLGQTQVAVFDFNMLTGNSSPLTATTILTPVSPPFTGLIGAQTLERLKAIIDCNAMQLYIKPPRGGWRLF